jgi:probable rRNA maturation factor
MFQIEIHSETSPEAADDPRLKQAAAAIFREALVDRATLSIAIVDDPTIHELNRQFLQHDYPTDVLSFLLDRDQGSLEGDVVVSLDTAARQAAEFGWGTAEELLLYVIHGTLHLVGHDDQDEEARTEMRAAERRILAIFGIEPRDAPTPTTETPVSVRADD